MLCAAPGSTVFRRRFRRKKTGEGVGGFVQNQVRESLGEDSGMLWCEARSASTRFWRMFWRLWYSQVRFNKICGFLFAETELRSLQPSTPQHPSERFGRKKHAAFRDTTETHFLLKFEILINIFYSIFYLATIFPKKSSHQDKMQPTSLNPHTYDNGTSSETRRYGNIMDVKEVLSKYRSILCCVCGGGIAAKKNRICLDGSARSNLSRFLFRKASRCQNILLLNILEQLSIRL